MENCAKCTKQNMDSTSHRCSSYNALYNQWGKTSCNKPQSLACYYLGCHSIGLNNLIATKSLSPIYWNENGFLQNVIKENKKSNKDNVPQKKLDSSELDLQDIDF